MRNLKAHKFVQQGCFFFHYTLAISMTNWVKICLRVFPWLHVYESMHRIWCSNHLYSLRNSNLSGNLLLNKSLYQTRFKFCILLITYWSLIGLTLVLPSNQSVRSHDLSMPSHVLEVNSTSLVIGKATCLYLETKSWSANKVLWIQKDCIMFF